MAVDREATLRNAEKFLRVGRLDAAIAEYARVVDEQPRDWSTANTLGDLYLRAGQAHKAVALYQRIADHLLTEGFFPKAAALLKKILKITPDDEAALVHLGDIASRQGLLAEARSYFTAVASRRQARGDAAGADDMVIRLGALDPADLDARLAGARAVERRGDSASAAAQYRELFDEFTAKGRDDAAASTLADYARCQPGGADSGLAIPLLTMDLRTGQWEPARARLDALLASGAEGRRQLEDLAGTLADSHPEAAVWCVEAAVDHAIAEGDYQAAAGALERLVDRFPGNIAGLLRLVEVCVDGGLSETMYGAQERLADAYLAEGRADEARVIAEDLVIHDGTVEAHVQRLRRALEMLGVANLDAAIEERVRISASDATDADALPESGASPDPPAPPLNVQSQEPAVQPASVPPTDASRAVAEPEIPAPAPPVAASPVMEIDLTTILGDLRAAADPVPLVTKAEAEDLDRVFAGLRSDAEAAEADDAGDYVDLARSYLDMGLPDEAIGPLTTAAKSPRWRFTAASMLAVLFRDAGDLAQAIEWYERAAEAPAPGADEARTLLYDLGDLLETLGESDRALAIFMEVGSDLPGFKDVSARIARLSSAEGGG